MISKLVQKLDIIDIPVIGLLISILASLLDIVIVLPILLAVAVLFVFVIPYFLYSIYPLLAILYVCAGIIALFYCASYVWGMRKPWFFWMGVIIAIIILVVGVKYFL